MAAVRILQQRALCKSRPWPDFWPAFDAKVLQQFGKRPQFSRSSDETIAGQSLKIIVDRTRRILEPSAYLLNAIAEQPLRKVQMIAEKIIRVLCVYLERF